MDHRAQAAPACGLARDDVLAVVGAGVPVCGWRGERWPGCGMWWRAAAMP